MVLAQNQANKLLQRGRIYAKIFKQGIGISLLHLSFWVLGFTAAFANPFSMGF